MEPILNLDRIREALAEGLAGAGETQLSASKITGLPVSKVNRFLNGRRGKRGEDVIEMINRLAAVAQLDIRDLLGIKLEPIKNTWREIPVFSLRGLPPMGTDRSKKVADLTSLAEVTRDRINVPTPEPGSIALRLPERVLDFRAGEVIVVLPSAELVPGKPVVVQFGPRSEIGIYQLRGRKGLVLVDGHAYDETECLILGRVTGAWREV